MNRLHLHKLQNYSTPQLLKFDLVWTQVA